MNRSKRNKLLLAVLAIALFIPTIVAIVNYTREQKGPIDTKSVVEMTLTDIDGNEYQFDNNSADKAEVADMFLKMREAATPEVALPSVLDQNYYRVVMSNGSVKYSYRYYFDITGSKSYIYDEDSGEAFSLEPSAVAPFLTKSQYASSLYKDAKFPTLNISVDSGEVKPSSAAWAFKAMDGNLVSLNTEDRLAKGDEKYEVNGGIRAEFDKAPDYLHVEIKDASSEEVLFNGDYTNGEIFRFEGAAEAAVSISAKWYHDDARSYEGEIGYSFEVSVTEAASFYLGIDTIDYGEVVAVTATNVANPENIVFTCDPPINCKPVFYGEGTTARAIIPFSLDSQAELNGTDYKLTFEYGAVKQTLNVKVNFRDYQRNTNDKYAVSNDVASRYTDDTVAAAEAELRPVLERASDGVYFDGGSFSLAVANGTVTRYFGRSYTVTPGDRAYRQNGIEYSAADGANAVAAAKGKVVYVGSLDLTGNVVVLDHGYGLKTLYAHLGSVSVSVGDVVEKGAPVGTCGNTGFTNVNGVYLGTYVGGVTISPYTMWDDGAWRTFPNP